MLLKRLELQGFKSFADKTILEFVEGSTAVVGPNGSGKSNISDAIRWVIGEMSAKSLRGSNMQDVIFAGTETRKPVNFAEVSLVLDNSSHLFDINYDEVVVTRRLFRSGESVYQINRSNCRLKDIHELFMDTGLGRDGYSIIGQGNVSQILSTKAEDRRSLFEEAAGISKYKYRREEAERKRRTLSVRPLHGRGHRCPVSGGVPGGLFQGGAQLPDDGAEFRQCGGLAGGAAGSLVCDRPVGYQICAGTEGI